MSNCHIVNKTVLVCTFLVLIASFAYGEDVAPVASTVAPIAETAPAPVTVDAGGAVETGVAAPVAIAEDMIAPSVLQRFKAFSGERTSDALIELFTTPSDARVRQQPQIAISDGSTAIIVAIDIPDAKDTSPNFTLKGASTISLNRIRANAWQLTALPQRGAADVVLVIMKGSSISEYPLTVVPPLSAAIDLSDVGFRIYLAADGGMDLNADGRSDYLDDYIFTGNYLAQRATVGTDIKSRQQRALRNKLTVKPPPPPLEPEMVIPPMELPDNQP